ncbi:protein of unknown function (DUF4378) [Castilleja foliolosa]|uniref:DUF4378 domain-containing protein n=1 Tax=Castilleja foliolosa TaxID=1961234 RepID=A0ABD3C4J3_9LAMI
MSAKTMSSIRDENGDLQKQIGCMNGIFQIFDRQHFLSGRRMSGGRTKRLLQGSQYQLDPHYTNKAITLQEKTLEAQKEKPRISTESSRASYSSSSCSSTFSSLDFNRISQTERKNKPESPFPIKPTKEPQSLDLRDVVKDSMYREARGLSIKALSKDEKRGTVMKHIDSPRPSLQSKSTTPKPIIPEGSTRVLARAHQTTKDEQLALPRFSYDGRESRDVLKWGVKHKEFPRLSLDSKTHSMKFSGLDSLESRLSILGPGLQTENESSSHNRTSSVVAKLMGLEDFPDTICTDENRTQNQVTYSSRVSQNNPASPSPRYQGSNVVMKPNTYSRFPIEQATRRQQDSSQISPKIAAQSRKAPTNNRNLSPSVYGEIEKRVTELQFQKSSKDLRALKQILEAMQKTRERLEDQTGESNSSMWSYHQVPTIEGPRTPKKSGSPVDITKPSKVMGEVRIPVSNSKNHVEKNSAHRQKTKDLTSKNNNLKNPTWHLDRPQRKKVENCTAPGRSFGMVSPRLQQNLFRIEGQSQPTATSSNSSRVKGQSIKKVVEKGLQNRKHKVKANDMQSSDEQLSEISIETRYSSYQNDTASIISESNSSLVSQAARKVTSLARKENYVSVTGEHMQAVRTVVTVSEQPSPISVLDDTFYCEESPSPVKKISTAFQDESVTPDEAEWHLDNLNHLTDCKRSNHANKYNQKLENLKVQELTFLTEPDSTYVDYNVVLSHNPDHRYINKILLTSGLLNDPNFISTTDQHLSSCHLINPDMFHVLEQTEQITGKSDRIQLKNKSQRKLIFDMVDEILVRTVTSGRLFTSVIKNTSPQGLLKKVYLEMDRACMIQERNLEDEDDEMIRLLTADMMYQDDWVDYNGEVPALVLDIERLIFKELINEVITGEVTCLNDGPLRHCRKLFSK